MHYITLHHWSKFQTNFTSGLRPKTAQKQSKIVLSAGMKIFEISKLENYKLSDINET